MYSKENYKKDVNYFIQKNGYIPAEIGKLTYKIFINHQRDIDDSLYDKLLDIANMEMGEEFEMSEEEFNTFLKKL